MVQQLREELGWLVDDDVAGKEKEKGYGGDGDGDGAGSGSDEAGEGYSGTVATGGAHDGVPRRQREEGETLEQWCAAQVVAATVVLLM